MKLKVTHISNPTPDAISLHFKRPENFAYKAGQYGVFRFRIDNEFVARTYSFHTSPDTDLDLGITVRRVEGGNVSNYLLNTPVTEVEIDGVMGEFFIESSQKLKRHLVMFAGGSGITPIISIIKTVLNNESLTSISLIYSNQTFDRIIFRSELLHLESQFQNRIKIYHVLTKNNIIPADFPVFYKDRLSKLIIKKLLRNIMAEVNCDIEYYLSGPYEFMQIAEDSIRSIDINTTKVYKEHFYIPSNPERDFDLNQFERREVVIRLKREERPVTVDGGKSILEASLINGIQLAHSCKEGQCGVCRSILISGEVKLRKNYVLTPEELNAGQILLCQGFPASENVVVQPLHLPLNSINLPSYCIKPNNIDHRLFT
jgi:ring-1,2-phenylacetyl-CoA epoxidase subunit PaaE